QFVRMLSLSVCTSSAAAMRCPPLCAARPGASPWKSALGAGERRAGDDDALHLARPLVDHRDPRVAEVPLGAELPDVAVAPMDLHRVVADADGRLAGEHLGHRRLARERPPLPLEPR